MSKSFSPFIGNPFNIRFMYDDNDLNRVDKNPIFGNPVSYEGDSFRFEHTEIAGIITGSWKRIGIWSADWKEILAETNMSLTVENDLVLLKIDAPKYCMKVKETTLRLIMSIIMGLDSDKNLEAKLMKTLYISDEKDYHLDEIYKSYISPLAATLNPEQLFWMLEIGATLTRALSINWDTDFIYQVANVADITVENPDKVINGLRVIIHILYKTTFK